MIVMSVARKHGREITQRAFATVGRVHCRSIGGMTSDHVACLEHRSRQCACRGRFRTDETSSNGEHAADSVGKFAGEIGQDLVKLAVLEPEMGAWVIVRERLGFALLHGKRE